MPVTISHALSATTPDDPAFEIRPSHWNSGHLGTINAVGSEVSGAFGNGGGVTFGVSADGKITAAAPPGTPSPVNFSVAGSSDNLGSVVFTNAGGVSWGLNGSTISATVKTDYLTTARRSTDAVGLNTAQTNVTWTVNSSGISFNAGGYAGTSTGITGGSVTLDSSGIAINLPAYLTTARRSTDAIGLNTAQSNVTWTVNSSGLSFDARGYAGTGTSATGATLTLNSNGLQISVAAGSNQTVGMYATGNTTNNSSTTFDARTLGTINALGGLTAGYSNGSIQLSVPATSLLSATGFLSISSNGGTVSIGAGPLSFYATSNTTQSSSGTIDGRSITFAGAGGASIGISNGSIVVSGGAAAGIGALYDGANSISSGTARFTNANGVSFTFNGQTISGSVATTYRASNDGVGLNTAKTNVTWTVNSSGISLDAGGYAGTASGFTGTGVSATFTHNTAGLSLNLAISAIKGFGVSNTGNTAGNTGVSTGIDWVVAGSNNITASQSTTAGGPNTLWISGPTVGGAQTGISGIIVSDGTYTSGTVSFSNAGNITIASSVNGATQFIKLSGNAAQTNQSAIKAFGVSNTGVTAGNTGVSTGIDWVLAGSQSITLSQSTAVGGPNTVWMQHPAWLTTAAVSTVGLYATGNTTNNSSTTFDPRTMGTWNAQGAATIGFSNGSVQVSVPATSSIVGTNGISVSTNGSTISVQPQWVSSYENMEGIVGTSALTWNGASVSHAVAFMLPWPISGSFIRIPALMTTNSTTISTIASGTASAQGALSSTINVVIYSLGTGGSSQSLQSVASGSAGYTFSQKISMTNSTNGSYSLGFSAQANGGGTTRTTQYSISNTNYSFTTDQIATEWSSNRFLDIPFANSLSPGAYWAVIGMSSATSSAGNAAFTAITNCNVRYSNHYGVSQADLSFGVMGSVNRTSGGFMGAGSFSTAGGGTTNSMDMSNISSIASLARMYFQILRSA